MDNSQNISDLKDIKTMLNHDEKAFYKEGNSNSHAMLSSEIKNYDKTLGGSIE